MPFFAADTRNFIPLLFSRASKNLWCPENPPNQMYRVRLHLPYFSLPEFHGREQRRAQHESAPAEPVPGGEEAGSTPFCPSHEKFRAVFVKGVGKHISHILSNPPMKFLV